MECVFTVANQKGGVGKSSVALNLGIGLAREGNRVLAIDLDAQSNLTISLGYRNPDNLNFTISDVMNRIIEDEPLDPEEGILHHPEGIDLMPSNIQLSGMEATLVNTMGRENVLRCYVNDIKHRYDFIIIDTMPSLGMLTINALAAADSVIVPGIPHFLSTKGLELLMKTIAKVRKQINPNLRVEGILLTMVDRRSNFTRDMADTLRESYGSGIRVFRTEIPFSVRAVETTAEGKSIYEYDPRGKVALQAITPAAIRWQKQAGRIFDRLTHSKGDPS